MNQKIDLSNLKKLLAEEKFEEAKEIMEDYFSQPLTDKELGWAYLNVAEIYMDIATHFGKQQKDLLQSALSTVESLDKKSKKLGDIIDLENIRNKIKES